MEKIYIVLIALGSVLIIALAIVVLYFLSRKKRFVRQAQTLDKNYQDCHTQLITDCDVMINRLGSLGKYNVKFQNYYNERKKQYEEILKNRDAAIVNSIKTITAYNAKKEYSKAKALIKQTSIAIEEYSRSVSTFSGDLSNLLREDSDTSEASLSIKNKYHKIKDFYEQNKAELKPLENSFSIIFKNAEDTFSKYAIYTDRAEFEQAKALLPELDNILTALLDIIEDLPTFESLINTSIPAKLEKLNQTYTQMVNEGYDLNYLRIPANIQSMNDRLEEIRNKLQYLDVTNVKKDINYINNHIADITVKLDQEKAAKEKFNNSQDIIQTSTFSLEKEYSKHMNQMQSYLNTYVLDSKYVNQMKSLKGDIEDISYLKRELDGYIGTQDKQPYTVICTKMDQMQTKITKVKKTMADYSSYLDDLKTTAENLYLGLRDYYILLKTAQYKIKSEIAVSSYVESISNDFNSLFNEINEIDKIILTQPVDVTKAQTAFEPFKEKCNNLIDVVKNKAEECKSAETAIVYANAYRMDYSDSRSMLDTAEKAFMEGDFDRAKEEAKKVINTFNVNYQTSKAE